MTKSILYVDDEPINTFLFSKMFGVSYHVITANSGQEGLDILMNNPDVKIVLSDMKMPKMDGIEFIKTARETFSEKNYMIISGFMADSRIEEALSIGLISYYMNKPFNKVEIAKNIESSLQQIK